MLGIVILAVTYPCHFNQKLETTKKLLDKHGVTYSVNLFETDAGISSLERDPFAVSSWNCAFQLDLCHNYYSDSLQYYIPACMCT